MTKTQTTSQANSAVINEFLFAAAQLDVAVQRHRDAAGKLRKLLVEQREALVAEIDATK